MDHEDSWLFKTVRRFWIVFWTRPYLVLFLFKLFLKIILTRFLTKWILAFRVFCWNYLQYSDSFLLFSFFLISPQ